MCIFMDNPLSDKCINCMGSSRRRKFLATVGSGFTLSIAGCSDSPSSGDEESGDGSGGDGSTSNTGGDKDDTDPSEPEEDDTEPSEPANLELRSVTPQSEPVFRSDFELSAEVANTGDEPVNRTITMSIVPAGDIDVDEQSIESQVGPLEGGGQTTITFDPYQALASGSYRITTGSEVDTLADSFSDNFSISPLTKQIGQTVETRNELSITVERVSYEQALLTKGDNDRGNEATFIRESGQSEAIVLTYISIENNGGSGFQFDENYFNIANGRTIDGIDPVTIDGPSVQNLQVNPSTEKSGWYATTVNISDIGELELGLNPVSTQGQPDIIFDFPDSPDIPEFEVEDFSVPEQRQPGEQQFSFEIRNTGDVRGTFRGTMEYLFPDEEDTGFSVENNRWYEWDPVMTASIPSGETRTVTASSTSDSTVRYRFKPLGVEFVVQN